MKITKAILTGGGRATRLRPITTTINKHLIPLANEPMIFHAIKKVVAAGIKEIFINTNPGERELQRVVGDGSRWGIHIQYFEQEGGPQGIAHVVNCAHKYIGDDPFMFYLSDNIILGSLDPLVQEFSKKVYDCMLAFSKVPDPERFGVPVFDANGNLTDVIEKPTHPANSFAVTGIYLYGPKLFFEAFNHIQKSPRGEYEISDIHSYLLKNNFKVGWKEVTGWWKDTGKPTDLLLANQSLLEEIASSEYRHEGCPDTQCHGKVSIGAGSSIAPDVHLIGPVIIGEKCTLENCTVGPNVTVGAGSSIKNATIRNSIIFSRCTVDSTIAISDSIIGDQASVVTNRAAGLHRLIIGDHTLIEV